jgi:hypothetical protein
MTLEINELSVQISVDSGHEGSERKSPAIQAPRITMIPAEIRQEIIKQSVAEVLTRLRRMEGNKR